MDGSHQLPPADGFRSYKVTACCAPDVKSSHARAIPVGPAPTMCTCIFYYLIRFLLTRGDDDQRLSVQPPKSISLAFLLTLEQPYGDEENNGGEEGGFKVLGATEGDEPQADETREG